MGRTWLMRSWPCTQSTMKAARSASLMGLHACRTGLHADSFPASWQFSLVAGSSWVQPPQPGSHRQGSGSLACSASAQCLCSTSAASNRQQACAAVVQQVLDPNSS